MDSYNQNGRPAPYMQQNPYYGTWSYTVPPAGGQQPGQTPPGGGPAKKKGGAGKVIGSIALVMACAVAGFGGGALALQTAGENGSSVIYRSVETGAAAAGGAEPLGISGVAAQTIDSVVSIVTENVVTNPLMGGQVVSGAGSGVVLSADGLIVTNHHVVEGASNIKVALQNGEEYTATLLGSDSRSDIAVLRIEAENLTPAVLGDSGGISVGEFCMAIGNPMGTLGGTVTDGIISALDREMTIGNYKMSLLQMSAPVSPGNSGGGLFNANGELIGIVNAKSGGENTEGLGFAIPINTAMEVAEEIINNGQVTGRPALGVSVQTIQSETEAALAGVSEAGVYIIQLTPGGGAEAAGLQVGDRFVSVNGQDITTTASLTSSVEDNTAGDTIPVVVSRGGQQVEAQLTLGELTA